MNWLQEIATLKLPPLKAGSHPEGAQSGLCAMEMVAFMERLPHSDSPPCTCPVIAAFVRRINDRMSNADRQRLLAFLPRLVGTVSPEHRVERAEYLVREVAHQLVAPLYHKSWPQYEAEILRAHTMQEIWQACKAAGAYAAYAAADAAYAAADAAAADAAAAAYAADAAADAAAYDADAAAAKKRFADVTLEILDGVLKIGPSAKTFSAPERLRELCELA